ncbi:MAG: type I restriction endonuclease [Cetobacterium sp.]
MKINKESILSILKSLDKEKYKINKSRPDIILFVNGLPLVVIELKSMSNDTRIGIKTS